MYNTWVSDIKKFVLGMLALALNLTEVYFSHFQTSNHTVAAYAKYVDYILGVVFYPKPSSVSDVAGIQSVHASLN